MIESSMSENELHTLTRWADSPELFTASMASHRDLLRRAVRAAQSQSQALRNLGEMRREYGMYKRYAQPVVDAAITWMQCKCGPVLCDHSEALEGAVRMMKKGTK